MLLSVLKRKCGRSWNWRASSCASTKRRPEPLAEFEPSHAEAIERDSARGQRGEDQSPEPHGLVEPLLEDEIAGGSGLVPDAVLVGGAHPEAVAAGRKVRVVGGPARACIDPFLLEALEPIAEAHRPGIAEREGRVRELEPPGPRRQPQRAGGRQDLRRRRGPAR